MLNKKLNDTIKSLEKTITDKKELEFVKSQITDLAITYLDDMFELEKKYEAKLKKCESRVDELEKHLQKLEAELFEEDEEFEQITCPYCNAHFMIECDHSVTELDCPECNNTIELNWEEFEDDDM